MEFTSMKLVIHDLTASEWENIKQDYEGDQIISDSSTIQPCVGCFGCWNKTPGQCVLRDGYENMGALVHQADEIVVISRYTYGGFSGFVKNVFDRCLGYVLPQFEVINGETHHKKRYEEDKPFTFIFYGHGLSEEEKESARRYVKAVCTNIRGHVNSVCFKECEETIIPWKIQNSKGSGKTVLLIGSMRSQNGNSAKLARKLEKQLHGKCEIILLRNYLSNLTGLFSALEGTEKFVLCMPLYVDGLPSQVIRFMENAQCHPTWSPQKVYVLANMGLYESSQLINLFSAVKQWCIKMNADYCGGLGISAGELLGVLMEFSPFRFGPTRNAAEGMSTLADAILRGAKMEEIYTEPFRFPRSLYIKIANTNWNRTAKRNGIKLDDLYRRL